MAQVANAGPTGAELARSIRRRLTAATVGSNLIGGLTALAFGVISPFPAEPDNETRLLLLNLGAFVIVMGAGHLARATPGRAAPWATRSSAGSWRSARRPRRSATSCCAQPILIAGIAVNLWVLAALAFTGRQRDRVGRARRDRRRRWSCSAGSRAAPSSYLLVERISRPVVARALADGPLARPVAPAWRRG